MKAFCGKTVLLAFPDANASESLTETVAELGLEVSGRTATTAETLDFLMRRECDFVFVSIFLPMLPVEGIEKSIASLPLYKRPAVLYFSGKAAGEIMLNAYSPSVALPVNANNLCEKMKNVYPPAVRDEDIIRANGILARMGFEETPARNYLARACALSANDLFASRSLKRSIYPALSRAFGVSESKIADAIRRLIDKTFLTGDIENQYRLFGSSIDETRGKPTVSQLIALVSEILRTEKSQ